MRTCPERFRPHGHQFATPHPGQAGQGLIELLLAMALFTGVVVAAQDIWTYATRLSTLITLNNLDPSFTSTASLLRKDLQRPSAGSFNESWGTGNLVLRAREDSSSIVWEVKGRNLVRYENRANGASTRSRVLSDVEKWRWRETAPGLFEVEITISVHADPASAAAKPKTVGIRQRRQITRRFVVATRGGELRQW